MSLARGKFGVEYNPRQMERDSSGLGWVIALVALVACASLAWTLVKRLRAPEDDPAAEVVPAVSPDAVASNAAPAAVAAIAPAAPVVNRAEVTKRPPRVRNLLMRLEEAERTRDVEMAVSTIETIRALPGSPAADLDDALARRLGKLNVLRLFDLRSAQWVKTVTVRRGDSASRIAAENGSTLASLARLNGGNVEKVILGAKLYVMNHPRFNLVIHRRTRIADLSLNGKFFKRYDLQGEVKAAAGAYEIPERKRTFWDKAGVQLRPEDRTELETLLPVGAPVLVSEM